MAGTQRLLAVTMSFSLLLAGVPASGKTGALGIIVQAELANLGSAAASNGTTIYDGDHLSTAAGGSLRVAAGEAMLYLTEQSSVIVREAADGAAKEFEAELLSGGIEFSVAAGTPAAIMASSAWIRPLGEKRGVVQVRRVGPNELIVFARQGPARISYHGESETIEEGKSYRVLLNPSEDGAAGGGSAGDENTKKAGRPNKALLLVALVVIVIATIPPVIKALESPDRP
ncbi:MAG: hypothetical protein WA765_01725 [Candidatus Acidiferrum sp.]